MPQFNTRAMYFSLQQNLLWTVGLDSHHISEIGASTLTLPDFEDAASLKNALANAQPHV
jgi:hypothetical protein